MQNQTSLPVTTCLHRPTLPSKNMIIARKLPEENARPPLGQCVSLSQNVPAFDKNDETPLPSANLVSEAPSDDEKKTTSVPASSSSSVSGEVMEETENKVHHAQAKRTGVYIDNVEILSAMHPLQCCSVKDGNSPLQWCTSATLAYGRPLSAAPALPRHQSGLKPISFPTVTALHSPKRTRPFSTFERNFKKQCLSSQDSQVSRAVQAQAKRSRAAQVKEASFMIEAAVTLTNLHDSRVS